MAKTIETLRLALASLSKIAGENDRIEGAPKESGDDGPVPLVMWKDLRRDLADLPRGERWVVRKVGTGRGKVDKGGNVAKGVYIAVHLPRDESAALVGYTPNQIDISRQQEAREWEILRKYEAVVEFKDKALEAIFARISDLQGIAGQCITHANNAGSSANLIAELTGAHAQLLDEISEVRADNNTAKGIMHIINRIISAVQMRKIKSWEELRNIPELKKDIEEFHKWKDERDAPPPGDE